MLKQLNAVVTDAESYEYRVVCSKQIQIQNTVNWNSSFIYREV